MMEEAKIALLKKYLKGDCTPEELHRVRQLLDEEGSDALLSSLMTEMYIDQWEHPQQAGGEELIDVERVKEKLAQRVANSTAREGRNRASRPVFQMFGGWKSAAVWAGLIILSTLSWFHFKNIGFPNTATAYIEKLNTDQQPQPHILPDSSVVYLGSGGIIRYSKDYGQGKREVLLEGQAFFEITHDQNNPFTVVTDLVHTTVLGTSFKVDAFEGQPLVVAVATGKVAVNRFSREGKQALALLTPGRKVTWDEANRDATESPAEVYGLAQWKNGELVFDEQPLGIVFRELEERYGWEITGADTALEGYRVSAMFPNGESLQQIMKVLSHLGGFTYSPEGEHRYHIRRMEER